jgi:hypothetical protein
VLSAAQTWGSSKGTQQVVASSGKGDASMGRTQVVKEVRKQLAVV